MYSASPELVGANGGRLAFVERPNPVVRRPRNDGSVPLDGFNTPGDRLPVALGHGQDDRRLSPQSRGATASGLTCSFKRHV